LSHEEKEEKVNSGIIPLGGESLKGKIEIQTGKCSITFLESAINSLVVSFFMIDRSKTI